MAAPSSSTDRQFLKLIVLFAIPITGHFKIEEGGGPGYQYQAGQGFKPGQEAQVANGYDIADAKRSVASERKVNAVQQAAIKIPSQGTPVVGFVHKIIRDPENPNFCGVSGKREEYAQHDAKAVPYFHFRHQQGDPVQKLVVNHHGHANDEQVDYIHSNHDSASPCGDLSEHTLT
jgi:hypothetical protein